MSRDLDALLRKGDGSARDSHGLCLSPQGNEEWHHFLHCSKSPGPMVSDMVTYPEGSGNAVEEAVARRGGVRRTLAPLYDVGAWAQTNTSQNIDGFTPTFKITIL